MMFTFLLVSEPPSFGCFHALREAWEEGVHHWSAIRGSRQTDVSSSLRDLASARLVPNDAASLLARLKSVDSCGWVGCRLAPSSPGAAATSPVKSSPSAKSTSAPTSPAKAQASPDYRVDGETGADEGVSLEGVELEGLGEGAAAEEEGSEVITVSGLPPLLAFPPPAQLQIVGPARL